MGEMAEEDLLSAEDEAFEREYFVPLFDDFTIKDSDHLMQDIEVEHDAAVPCFYLTQGSDVVQVSPQMLCEIIAKITDETGESA